MSMLAEDYLKMSIVFHTMVCFSCQLHAMNNCRWLEVEVEVERIWNGDNNVLLVIVGVIVIRWFERFSEIDTSDTFK